MKKYEKMISVLLIIFITVVSISNFAYAAGDADKKQAAGTGIPGVISGLTNPTKTVETTSLTNMGAQIVAVVQTIGIVVAVVILLVLGIKYMVGSAEEKAEYKKTMIPYLVGAVLIFAATTLVNVVYQMANSINA